MKFSALSALACLFLVSNLSYGQWTTNISVNTAVCLAAGDQGGYDIYNPGSMFKSIPDGSGGVIIVWPDKRGGTYWDIYAQRLNANGVAQWGLNGIPICNATNDQYYMDVVSDGAGGAVIVWQDQRNSSTTYRDIYAQRINSSGTTLWAANGVVVCNASDGQVEPSVIADGAGNYIVVWTDGRLGDSGNIYGQKINSSGVAQWTLNGISICSVIGLQYYPALVSDNSGGCIVTWYDDRLSGDPNIYAQRINSSGTAMWTVNGQIICGALKSQVRPQIVTDHAGGAIIVWLDSRSSPIAVEHFDIYGQKISASGTAQWTTNGIPICTATDDQRYFDVVSDGMGGCKVAWQDPRNGTSYPDIYTQFINSSGVPVLTFDGDIVCNAVYDQTFPNILAIGSDIVVSWTDGRNFSDANIYAQKLNSAGIPQYTLNGIQVTSSANTEAFSLQCGDGSSGFITVFNRITGSGEYDIYAQNMCGNGIAGGIIPSTPVTITGNSTICSGSSNTYSITPVAGATSYTWTLPSGWSGTSSTTSINTTASSVGGNITVVANSSCGSSSVQTLSVSVNSLPTIAANASDNSVCVGESTILTGSGASSYTWSGGVTDGISFAPTSTSTYTVTGTDVNTCSNTSTITITVHDLPMVTTSASDNVLCNGESTTLTGGGAASYVWSGGVTDGISFVPASTTTYTVTGTDVNTCSNTSTITITVHDLPTVTTSASDNILCNGENTILTGGGAASYVWSGGVIDGISFIPASTTTYTVTGTDVNMCSNTSTITITVHDLPTVTTSASDNILCNGESTILSGGGATNYIWSGGVTDGISFVPASTTTYTVTGTDINMCSNTSTITITVHDLPTVTTSASDNILCNGENTILTGGGAASYVWSGGVTDGISFVPASTTTYTVTGTDVNMCSNTSTITITVHDLPTVTASSSDNILCNGESTVLSGAGATNYIWSGGVTDGVSFVPTSTTTYTVTGTDVNLCSNTATISITVNNLPDVSVSQSGITITANNAASSFQWIDCAGSIPIPGAVSQSYTASLNGNYAVVISNGLCIDTSECITINHVGINPSSENLLSVYPNPAVDFLTVVNYSAEPFAFYLLDLSGRLVMNGNIQIGNNILDIQLLPPGMYHLVLGPSISIYKIIKQ